MNCTAMEPSPTPDATRFTDPWSVLLASPSVNLRQRLPHKVREIFFVSNPTFIQKERRSSRDSVSSATGHIAIDSLRIGPFS